MDMYSARNLPLQDDHMPLVSVLDSAAKLLCRSLIPEWVGTGRMYGCFMVRGSEWHSPTADT